MNRLALAAAAAVLLMGNAHAQETKVAIAISGWTGFAPLTPAPNAAGWNNSDVTVSFTCAGGGGTVMVML